MSYKLPENLPYALTGFKTFRGMEGDGFNASLRFQGKVIGLVVDDGCGGPVMFQDMKAQDLDAFKAYAKSLPAYPADEATGCPVMEMDAELLVSEMANICFRVKDEAKDQKRFEKLIKKDLLFRLEGDGSGSWRTLKLRPEQSQVLCDPKNLADTEQKLRAKYPKLALFLNREMQTNPRAWIQ